MTIQDTLLILNGIGIPDYSARGIKVALTLIQQASQLRRTSDGTLINLSPPQFQKYHLEITCTDQRSPAFDGIWPGDTVTVSWPGELSYPSSGSPGRSVVGGSSRTEGSFVFYRPIFDALVLEHSNGFAEWQADYDWKLVMEEL